jgi:predicted Zn-dependent protease
MRKFPALVAAVFMLLASVSATAQVRGKGRLQGSVVEKETGKPVAGAKITINLADGSTAPIVVKTNAKGRWSAIGMISGGWNIDIDAEGYQPSRIGPINISETQMLPAVEIKVEKLVVQEEVAEVEVPMAGSAVPQEAIDAVNAGQDLMAQEKYKEAVIEFEKALPLIPDNMQLKQVAAQAYYKAGDLKKAIAALEAVTAADPSNSGIALLLTNLYLENGQLDEGKARLAALPADAVTDPTVYVNIGILFLNKNNPEEAAVNFSKAVDMDMTQPASFYYRGLANLQLKKMKEAKADFEKVISLAPDSTEAKDAKQLLDSMK